MWCFKNKNKIQEQDKGISYINVVIIRTSSIGDLVLSSSCLDLIKKIEQSYPLKFNVVWIGSAPSLEFIRYYYPNVYCIDIKQNGFSNTLKSTLSYKKVDIILNLQNNLRAHGFSRLLSCLSFVKVHGYDKRA